MVRAHRLPAPAPPRYPSPNAHIRKLRVLRPTSPTHHREAEWQQRKRPAETDKDHPPKTGTKWGTWVGWLGECGWLSGSRAACVRSQRTDAAVAADGATTTETQAMLRGAPSTMVHTLGRPRRPVPCARRSHDETHARMRVLQHCVGTLATDHSQIIRLIHSSLLLMISFCPPRGGGRTSTGGSWRCTTPAQRRLGRAEMERSSRRVRPSAPAPAPPRHHHAGTTSRLQCGRRPLSLCRNKRPPSLSCDRQHQ
jgi:hypothetical protein